MSLRFGREGFAGGGGPAGRFAFFAGAGMTRA